MKQLIKILGLLWRPIQANGAFFVFMFALGWLCTQTEVRLHLKGAHPYELSAEELFFDLYLLCTLLTLLPRSLRMGLRLLLAVVLYAVAAIDMFCYERFESTLTPTMVMLFLETNGREASEFLSSYVGWEVLSMKTGRVLFIALCHLVWSVLSAWWKRRKTMGPRLAKPVVEGTKALLGVAAACGLIWSATLVVPNKMAMIRLMTKTTLGEVEHELTTKDCATLYLPIHRMAFSLYANSLASQQISQMKTATGRVVVDSCDFRSPQIVLIIGESYNKHRSQLYGYRRPTTPRQLKRANDTTLVAYTDVVAPWNLTSFVFKHLFSLHAVGDPGEWCDMPMFPQLFRRAGYHVTFLTNQFLPKVGEEVYDFSGGFFLNHPVLSDSLFDTRNRQLYRYDDGLLRAYDKMIREHKYEHQLTIFHLMGQHVDYRGRFPQRTRRKFSPEDYNRQDLTAERQQINADYDNATLYNDSIVDEIIRRFEHDNAIVIYVPDHGEECFNDGQPWYGRMHSATIDRRLAREEFEIPFWIWASEEYRRTHPYGWEAIKYYRHRPYMTDLLPHTLLFLGGIHTKDYRPEYDVLSTKYNAGRQRLLKNSVDYNQLKRETR